MTANISGQALREQMLRKLAQPLPINREAELIEALAAPRTRELLVVIAQFSPRSIAELSAVVGRHQPNVSRSLTALVRAGLLTLESDGRASVPTLTEDGRRKASELSAEVDVSAFAGAPATEDERVTPILNVETVARPGDLQSDEVAGKIVLWGKHHSAPDTDLNEIATRLLRSWWRAFYRFDDPFKLFALSIVSSHAAEPGTLFIKALGDQVEMFVPESLDVAGITPLHTALSLKAASQLFLNSLIEPVARYLESGRRFDRPIHSMLRRLEDVMAYESEAAFARTAGALGLSPHDLSDGQATAVMHLIESLPEESIRLEFASSTLADASEAALAWVRNELRIHQKTNRFEGLAELKPASAPRGKAPWQVGKLEAEDIRRRLRLEDDQAIGGVEGMMRRFGAPKFKPSEMADDPLRGFRGTVESDPIIVVRDAGPAGTAFLTARAIGDYLGYPETEAPISEPRTDRQAMGRAFAAELLAPSAGVIQMIDDQGMTKLAVARHFGVDVPVVAHQYSNHAHRIAASL